MGSVLQIANDYFGTALYGRLFDALDQYGVDNQIFVPLHRLSQVKMAPAGVVAIPCYSNADRLFFYSKQKKMLQAMESHWDISQFDVIHAHTVFSGGYSAWKLYKTYGIPYVVAVRNTDVNFCFRYMFHLRHVGIRIMRDAAAVVFLSPAYRDSVIRTYVPKKWKEEIKSKSLVIPNGISEVFVHDRCAPHHISEKSVRLLYVGELNDNKNVSTTIKAIELLCDEGISATLTVVGPIREKKYEGYFERYPFATYLGAFSPDKVKDTMREADIFVMPSHMETFGLVYAEAMSQGLPVLYTRGQGFDGQFPDGEVGYAVDDHDPHDVAEKIKAVITGYDEIAQRAYENSTKFSWDKIAGSYYDLYLQILETYNVGRER